MMNKKIIVIGLLTILTVGFIYFIARGKRDESAAVNIYMNLIDLEITQDSGINDNTKYISIFTDDLVDPLSGIKLSDASKQQILDYLKKYGAIVYNKKYNELKDSKIINESTLIDINLISRQNNKATLTVIIYNGENSSRMSKYYIEYINGKWIYLDSGIKVQN